ncbi:hypothetical protein PVK06_001960 [Gossypium arboreum]|uniref:Uncharacterized protein n=1 Tax=Gossypium arboreum TaxID=29729 RepID=A0ABR0R2J8_GOSAR|nr:hypothetical protein PVK06_001960 [Gossypium arboreum]
MKKKRRRINGEADLVTRFKSFSKDCAYLTSTLAFVIDHLCYSSSDPSTILLFLQYLV